MNECLSLLYDNERVNHLPPIQSNPIREAPYGVYVDPLILSFIHIRSIIKHHHRDIVLLLPTNDMNKNENKNKDDRDDHELVASRDDALLLV